MQVTAFYERLCSAVHEVDPPTPCVVGPAPYYKVISSSLTCVVCSDPNNREDTKNMQMLFKAPYCSFYTV